MLGKGSRNVHYGGPEPHGGEKNKIDIVTSSYHVIILMFVLFFILAITG